MHPYTKQVYPRIECVLLLSKLCVSKENISPCVIQTVCIQGNYISPVIQTVCIQICPHVIQTECIQQNNVSPFCQSRAYPRKECVPVTRKPCVSKEWICPSVIQSMCIKGNDVSPCYVRCVYPRKGPPLLSKPCISKKSTCPCHTQRIFPPVIQTSIH